jgi:hypothetical protein
VLVLSISHNFLSMVFICPIIWLSAMKEFDEISSEVLERLRTAELSALKVELLENNLVTAAQVRWQVATSLFEPFHDFAEGEEEEEEEEEDEEGAPEDKLTEGGHKEPEGGRDGGGELAAGTGKRRPSLWDVEGDAAATPQNEQGRYSDENEDGEEEEDDDDDEDAAAAHRRRQRLWDTEGGQTNDGEEADEWDEEKEDRSDDDDNDDDDDEDDDDEEERHGELSALAEMGVRMGLYSDSDEDGNSRSRSSSGSREYEDEEERRRSYDQWEE